MPPPRHVRDRLQSLHLAALALATLVVAAPLPYAGVTPGAQFGLELAAAAVLIFSIVTPTARPVPAAGWIGPILLATVCVIGAARPGLVSPEIAGRAALVWLAVAAVWMAAARTGGTRQARRVLAAGICLAGVVQVALAALTINQARPSLWGTELGDPASRLRGTFVNPDHLAVFLGMALPVALAWGWWTWRHRREAPTIELRLLRLAPPVATWLVLFIGLAFTGSRAGLIAALTATLVQGALLALRRRRWRASASGLIAGAVGVGVVALIGLQQGLGRWLGTSAYELAWNDRLAVYRATLELWSREPIWGWGLGAFREVFPAVQPAGAVASATWWHAHNDWLELLATTGVIGAALVLAGLVVILTRLGRVLTDGARSEDAAAAVAAFGALTAVAIHSFFDFGLAMPANPIVLAVILGSAVAARAVGDSSSARTDGDRSAVPEVGKRRRVHAEGDRPAGHDDYRSSPTGE